MIGVHRDTGYVLQRCRRGYVRLDRYPEETATSTIRGRDRMAMFLRFAKPDEWRREKIITHSPLDEVGIYTSASVIADPIYTESA